MECLNEAIKLCTIFIIIVTHEEEIISQHISKVQEFMWKYTIFFFKFAESNRTERE